MSWYRHCIGRAGVKATRAATRPYLGDVDEMISVIEINKLVPRGVYFESLISDRNKVARNNDPTRMAMYNAIRRGLV